MQNFAPSTAIIKVPVVAVVGVVISVLTVLTVSVVNIVGELVFAVETCSVVSLIATGELAVVWDTLSNVVVGVAPSDMHTYTYNSTNHHDYLTIRVKCGIRLSHTRTVVVSVIRTTAEAYGKWGNLTPATPHSLTDGHQNLQGSSCHGYLSVCQIS